MFNRIGRFGLVGAMALLGCCFGLSNAGAQPPAIYTTTFERFPVLQNQMSGSEEQANNSKTDAMAMYTNHFDELIYPDTATANSKKSTAQAKDGLFWSAYPSVQSLASDAEAQWFIMEQAYVTFFNEPNMTTYAALEAEASTCADYCDEWETAMDDIDMAELHDMYLAWLDLETFISGLIE